MLLSGRVDLSYWTEECFFCLGTFEHVCLIDPVHQVKGRVLSGQCVAGGREKVVGVFVHSAFHLPVSE